MAKSTSQVYQANLVDNLRKRQTSPVAQAVSHLVNRAPQAKRNQSLPHAVAKKKRIWCIIPSMPLARKCIVRLRDTDGVEHVVQVDAGSLYEAGCVALRQFRRNDWSREATLKNMTLQVEVWQAPTVYKIGVDLLEKWLARSGGSPREVALRQRIRSRLSQEPDANQS